MMNTLKKFGSKTASLLWSLFITGLLTLLPLIITIGFFYLCLHIIVKLLEVLEPLYVRIRPDFLIQMPYVQAALIIGFFLLLGVFLRGIVFRSLIHYFESWLLKIPVVSPIYIGIKQLVHAFSLQDKVSFKQVVLVEYPRKGLFSIGFLTNELPPELAPTQGVRFYNIFMPTTPNPTHGYFIILPESEIIATQLTRQEAMALLISGGILQPERFAKKSE